MKNAPELSTSDAFMPEISVRIWEGFTKANLILWKPTMFECSMTYLYLFGSLERTIMNKENISNQMLE